MPSYRQFDDSKIDDVCWMTIAELARGLRHRRFTAVEVTDALLDRISRLDGTLGSYITVTADRARDDAARADDELGRGLDRGPLHGVPMGLKDLIDTAAIRTSAGSRILMDRVPARDATVVRRLQAAGMVLLGKHALTEFATGAADNPTFGMARNPWSLDRVPGSSSSGSAAAVAGGLAIAALGTDTSGSVRQPAALCGLVGVRPTRGAVPLGGVIRLSSSFDTVGPIARTVEDAALLLSALGSGVWGSRVLTGLEASRRATPLRGVRIAVPVGAPWQEIDPSVQAAVDTAMEQVRSLGAQPVRVDLGDVGAPLAARRTVQYAEAARLHRTWLSDRRADYDPTVLALLDFGASVDEQEELQARLELRRFGMRVRRQLRLFDVLASATTPAAAWGAGESRTFGGLPIRVAGLRLTAVTAAAGLAGMSLPCGAEEDGRPIGLQLACLPWQEPRMLAIAQAYERSAGWWKRRPTLTPQPASPPR